MMILEVKRNYILGGSIDSVVEIGWWTMPFTEEGWNGSLVKILFREHATHPSVMSLNFMSYVSGIEMWIWKLSAINSNWSHGNRWGHPDICKMKREKWTDREFWNIPSFKRWTEDCLGQALERVARSLGGNSRSHPQPCTVSMSSV